MIEIVIERWIGADGTTEYRWSLWGGGHRIQMGARTRDRAEDCESEARAFCRQELGREPEKVTRL